METATSCPDPEALAAFLDQGISADERLRTVEHLSTCDDCRTILKRVLETRNAVGNAPVVAASVAKAVASEAQRGGAQTSTTGRRLAWAWGSGLAAAAVLALVLVLPSWWPGTRTSIDSKLADLAAAVGSERSVEARLSGGFEHRPLGAVARSGGSLAVPDNWGLFAAAGKIREVAEGDPSPENLHALGLAYLVLDQYDEAVRALGDAATAAPDNARYHSDLAAAYLERARRRERPDDLPRALGAAERAVKADESLLEARFNRALVLQGLFLSEQARAAWNDYLKRDANSGWADEARAHLQKLDAAAASKESARNNSPPLVTDVAIEAGLNWLLRDGLSGWADAVLAGEVDRARREQLSLSNYAKELDAISGDAFASALVESTHSTSHDSALAARVRQLAEGLRALDAEDLAAAEQHFVAACVGLPAALNALCDVELGPIHVVRRDDASAERRQSATAGSPWIYVSGRSLRLAGYRRLYRGDFIDALEHYERAYATFADAKYLQQAANLAAQIADSHGLTGASVTGWKWRHRAFELLDRIYSDSGRVQQIALLGLAHRLTETGDHVVARVFLDAAERAERAHDGVPIRRLVATIEYGIAAVMHRDVGEAQESIRRAEQILAATSEFRVARMRNDVDRLKADVALLSGDSENAERMLSSVLSTMSAERVLLRVNTLLERARARIALNRISEGERDVREAIDFMTTSSARAESIQLAEASAAFHAVASLVSAHPDLHSRSGLLLVERLRELIDGVPLDKRIRDTRHFDEIVAGNASELTLYYLFAPDALLTWVVTADTISFFRRPITATAVESLTRKLTIAIERRVDEGALKSDLAALYELLLADLPHLSAARQLLVIPDGPLNQVPFGALFNRSADRYVFQTQQVRIAPNIALGVAAGRRPIVPKSVLAVGEPTLRRADEFSLPSLPEAKHEAYAVGQIYEAATVLVGDEATKARVLETLPTVDIFHYAGHALPMGAGLPARLLTAGTPRDLRDAITASDVASKLQNTSTVVLAGCETARNTDEPTAGVVSLAAGFLRAGASSTIATLWDIDDSGSEHMALSIHRALAVGKTAAAAVAQSQQQCYANPSCRKIASNWIGTIAYGLH